MIPELVEDPGRLEALAPEWDDLAVICEEPMASPAWMLGWLRHVAPADVRPRVVAVRDRGRLVALAPFYVRPGRLTHYRVLADDFSSRVDLLAEPGLAWDAAAVIARALTSGPISPDLISLAPMAVASPWTAALRQGWPGALRPAELHRHRDDAGTSSLHGTFEEWMMRRGSEFRRTVRRRSRALERDGGLMRLSTAETVADDIEAFVRLHRARWSSRGESWLLRLGPRLTDLLREVADQLIDRQRFRLWMVELEGRPICADLSVVAGGEVVGINTGWDEAHKRLAPAQIVTVRKVEDAYERGERRLDMGWGSLGYKRAFADGTDPITWSVLVPAGRRFPLGLASAAPLAIRRRLVDVTKRTLDTERYERLRGFAAGIPGGRLGPMG